MKSFSVLLGFVLISCSLFAVKSEVLFPVAPSTLKQACKRKDGNAGVSLFERECENGSDDMIGYIPHRGNVVCCLSLAPSLLTVKSTPATPVEPPKTARPDEILTKVEAGLKARNYCGERSSYRSLLLDKVISGRDSAVGEFPHQVGKR